MDLPRARLLDVCDTLALIRRSRKSVGEKTTIITNPDDLEHRPTEGANTGAVNERQRVSLTLRLAPDLVCDMEALILPGNVEMPSFAVRSELQKRYNVDRRHIYNYFHNRGLRVLREGKTNNASLNSSSPWVCSVPHISVSPLINLFKFASVIAVPSSQHLTERTANEEHQIPRASLSSLVGSPKISPGALGRESLAWIR